ncbi:MAG: hypothetical protein KC621_32070 [Myxococcales bacterium]|nr:hypothetical protein [Myxococcales bacterium]
MLSLLTSLALAQTTPTDTTPTTTVQSYGFDGHGFRLADTDADPRDPMQIYRPGASTPLSFSLGGLVEYANRPVVFEDAAGVRTSALSNVAALNLAGGFVPVGPLRIDVSMPVYLASSSVDYLGTSSSGAGVGDLRASAVGTVIAPGDDGGFGLGLLAALDLPTGDASRYLGTDGPAGLAGVVGTYEQDALTASWQVDARFAPNTTADVRPAPTRGGDTVDGAVALSYLVDEALGVGVEAHVAFPIDPVVQAAIGIPAEAMVTGRYRTASGGYGMAGLGFGLGSGAGASPIRVVVGGGFGTVSEPEPKDADLDGIVDKDDACPMEAETVNGLMDEDGCPDVLPTVTFVAKLDGVEQAEAEVKVTGGPAGEVAEKGSVTVSGPPGTRLEATAQLGACRRAAVQGVVPQQEGTTLDLPLARADGTVVVAVTDVADRPLDGVQVRYVIPDEACRPADVSVRGGRGIHTVGVGPIKVFVTAMGYDVFQDTFDLEPGQQKLVTAKLKPTSVRIDAGQIKTNQPVSFDGDGATLEARSVTTLDQVTSLLLSMDVMPKVTVQAWGGSKKVSEDRAKAVVAALTASGVPPELLEAVGKGSLPRGQTDVVRMLIAE